MDEEMIPGDLNFIMTNDEGILEINREFLKHNNFTDVIAFGYGEEKLVTGEIYISWILLKETRINIKLVSDLRF
jgi:ssRNA-specific RNase YbeY (16S rRNA maturation enzyme)